MNDIVIIHAPYPHVYPDKRGFQLTLCKIRVHEVECDEDSEVTCEQCKEEIMKDCEF